MLVWSFGSEILLDVPTSCPKWIAGIENMEDHI
jgi:hypothetical protein